MRHHKSPKVHHSSIVQAIETLSSIAELEIDSPIAIVEKEEITIQKSPLAYRTVHWLHRKNADKIMRVVKETFRVVLNYLKAFYKKEISHQTQHEAVEGLVTIMELVGEAAKKLDRFSTMLQSDAPSITELAEFQELAAFYQRKIAPMAKHESFNQLIQGVLPVKTAVGTSKRGGDKASSSHSDHLFIDLETVRNDSDYELFYIHKENGTRFFDPRLLRNMKLVSNFEEHFEARRSDHVSTALCQWQDTQSRHCAQNIVKTSLGKLNEFSAIAGHYIDNEYVMLLYRSLVALMLAAQEPASSISHTKGSAAYLLDFLKFLRELTSSHGYQEYIDHPTKAYSSIDYVVYHLVQNFLEELYLGKHTPSEVVYFIDHLILQGKEDEDEFENHHIEPSIYSDLFMDYEALLKVCRPLSSMPLLKVMNSLEDADIRGYDPLLLENLPSTLFTIDYQGHETKVSRLPSPTYQESIEKASVTEEFKGFLRQGFEGVGKAAPIPLHLIFNLQDRTSWREFARTRALESLQNQKEFEKSLLVVTMTKDSDFYQQTGPYQDLNQTELFIEQLLEHSISETSGYFYPEKVKKALFPQFLEALAKAIHEIFFASHNVLTKTQRMDFVELFYIFIQLKIIEVIQPDSVSFTCKDAVDLSIPSLSALFLVVKLINGRALSREEEEFVRVLLFATPLLVRGRNLFSDRFMRLHNLLRTVESTIEELGIKEFQKELAIFISPLFDSKILSSALKI
ncbi:MAG: hypothetical protein JWO53_799 [Chlamydiia bacterium]|nr:hypothetical protein [Chlamydiia bacterium]